MHIVQRTGQRLLADVSAHATPALARPTQQVAANRSSSGAMSKAASRFAFVSSDTADAKAALESLSRAMARHR